MKRKCAILLMVATMMTLAGCGQNDQKPNYKIDRYKEVYTVCVEGYQFALYAGFKQGGIVQVWENSPNGPRPMECKKTGDNKEK